MGSSVSVVASVSSVSVVRLFMSQTVASVSSVSVV